MRHWLQARLDFLDTLSKSGDLMFDEQRLLAFVLDHLWNSPAGGPRLRRRLRRGDGRHRPARVADARPAGQGNCRQPHAASAVVARREALLVGDASTGAERWRSTESFVLHSIRSVICAPMIFNGEIHGVLQMDNGKSPDAFERADLNLLRSVAYQVATSLAYSRLHTSLVEQQLIEHDLQLARKVQQNFLPEQPPTIEGYGFTVDYIPSLGVSGDFYDFLPFSPERIGIVVGDVSGKGVSAALYARTHQQRPALHRRWPDRAGSNPDAAQQPVRDDRARRDVRNDGAGRARLDDGPPGGRQRRTPGAADAPCQLRVDRVGRTGQPPIGVTENITTCRRIATWRRATSSLSTPTA